MRELQEKKRWEGQRGRGESDLFPQLSADPLLDGLACILDRRLRGVTRTKGKSEGKKGINRAKEVDCGHGYPRARGHRRPKTD